MDFLLELQELRTPLLDQIFLGLTQFGEETLLIIVMCAMLWCINKRSGYKLGIMFFFASAIVLGLKVTFAIQRPWILNDKLVPVEGSIKAATGYSFPSGHTQNAVSLWGGLALILRKRWAYLVATIIILLVGISRMYIGVHTPGDVFVSMLVGACSLLIIDILLKKASSEHQFMMIVTPIIIIVSILLMAFSVLKPYPEGHEIEMVADIFKGAGTAIAFFIGSLLERKYCKLNERAPLLWQLVKLIAGVGGMLLIKGVFKELFEMMGLELLSASFIRYFLIGIWVSFVYPLIIVKVTNHKLFGAGRTSS